jgi:hypothetical protein
MTISRLVARIEKEFNFWAGIYTENIPEINGTATEQTEQMESYLEDYRDKYRGELQSDLGQDFSVGRIGGVNEYNPLRNHFFHLEHYAKFAGIILPFRTTKQVVLNPRVSDNEHALEVFSNRNYKIEKIVCGYDFRDAVLLAVCDKENMNLVLEGKDLI